MSFFERYASQIGFCEIGEAGQVKLKYSSVLIIGCGALGTNMAELLARAGVGKLVICDPDKIELSNLSRQTLFSEADIGKNKALVAKEALSGINSEIEIVAYDVRFDAQVAEKIAENINLIMDATDNMESRYFINAFARSKNIPWIYSGVVGASGQVFVILPNGPCFECIYPKSGGPLYALAPCDLGVLNVSPATAAAIATAQAIKLLIGNQVEPKLIVFDLWKPSLDTLTIARDPNCQVCKLD